MLLHVLSSVGTTSAVFLTYALTLVLHQHPWWKPQYFIPILGMLLGNAISGVSVGLSSLLEELSTGKQTARECEGPSGSQSLLLASRWGQSVVLLKFSAS